MYCYDDHVRQTVHLALVKGDLSTAKDPVVRVHLQDTLGDAVGVQSQQLGWPLQDVIARVAKEEAGVVVILREHESSRELMEAVEGLTRTRNDIEKHRGGDGGLRTYGVGAQILRDLGVHRMRVISAPKQMNAISGFGLEIVEYLEH